MRVVSLNTYDTAGGGAARAVYRLHNGLRQANIQAFLVVQKKTMNDPSVIDLAGNAERILGHFRYHIDLFPIKNRIKQSGVPWGLGWLASNITGKVGELKPDLVHLHWIGHGFMSIRDVGKLRLPIIWTLHDSWPFTGGCHIPNACTNYTGACGNCPQLESRRSHDLSRWVWNRKNRYWRFSNLTIVAPSRWLASCATDSSLFGGRRIEVIPNGLDIQKYKPVSKTYAREVLSLPRNKKLILYGSSTPISNSNKGFRYLREALRELHGMGATKEMELVIFGPADPQVTVEGVGTNIIGKVFDDWTLALLYSAADVVCVPSISEAFGQTASEALACGTPVVAFKTSGLLDIVDDRETGYLATPFQASDLAHGISWVLKDISRWAILSENARRKACATFDINSVAKRYISLYEEVLRR